MLGSLQRFPHLQARFKWTTSWRGRAEWSGQEERGRGKDGKKGKVGERREMKGRVQIRKWKWKPDRGKGGIDFATLQKNITGAHDIITPPTLICCTPRDFSLSSLMTTAFAVVNWRRKRCWTYEIDAIYLHTVISCVSSGSFSLSALLSCLSSSLSVSLYMYFVVK